ncbi:hypothetical protein HXX76_000309 [Chlamydomonas incerta]|uniref:NAD-dependent epimerase/dehydratase domain-containing protein n=1 Tax=Chlamydomonas incerta TaxID=51695 RepID=A0A836B2J9_CHLIN|nr:hypothetical protein HXX76_000309 [Chlamydomonas incerta]|eukprot:KAG2445702.1 hypothetical protein HXX76_000309 [Chlamydomonas incerta]
MGAGSAAAQSAAVPEPFAPLPTQPAETLPRFSPASEPLARVPLYPEEASAAATRVAVTGATGYVAGNVVARLLAAGHIVHATVRDPSNEAAASPLKSLPGAAERLKLFKADLLAEGSFDAAVSGCEYVLHTASPFNIKVPPSQSRALLIDPAVKGVENVLAAVERSPSVKRVVLTSSIAAVVLSTPEQSRPGTHHYDESSWNTVASESIIPYACSKTLAEKRAWELCELQSRWSLVTICPGLVLGPPVSSRSDSESIGLVIRMMRGELWPASPWAGLNFVDVRDVAAAHTLAMSHPKAEGRYILSSCDAMLHDLPGAVSRLYPGGKLAPPLFFLPRWLVWLVAPLAGLPRDVVQFSIGFRAVMDTSKVQNQLGLRFVAPALTLRDMIEDLAARGLIAHPKPAVAAHVLAAAKQQQEEQQRQ